eukprot:scaffold353_cov185-Amphora_coffeaeformis.AAC.23
MMQEPYRSTTLRVAAILKMWAEQWAGHPQWASFLHKNKIRNEAEEAIVALYYLRRWMTTSCRTGSSDEAMGNYNNDGGSKKKFILLDACGGKGFFSCLVSYMASDYWQTDDDPHNHEEEGDDGSQLTGLTATKNHSPWELQRIILLEKATINWHHIHAANSRSHTTTNNNANKPSCIPPIEIWSDTNLHDYDELITKFNSICSNESVSLALTGIHLCKMLSPILLSLANGLGPHLCPYLCLAPCCLPRMATTSAQNSCRLIPIHRHESDEERKSRLDHNRRKEQVRSRRRGRYCYHCQSQQHWVRSCPEIQNLDDTQRDAVIETAIKATPCFNCGNLGHTKEVCPTLGTKLVHRYPPSSDMDVSDVRHHVDPYTRYCELLAQHVEKSPTGTTKNDSLDNQAPASKKPKTQAHSATSITKLQVIEAGLTDNGGHQEGNWNSRRKSIFIVVER